MATSINKHPASRAPPALEEVTEVVKAAGDLRREAALPVACLDTSKEPLFVLETFAYEVAVRILRPDWHEKWMLLSLGIVSQPIEVNIF